MEPVEWIVGTADLVRKACLDASRIGPLSKVRAVVINKGIAPRRPRSARAYVDSRVVDRRGLFGKFLARQSAKRVVFERSRLAALRDPLKFVGLIVGVGRPHVCDLVLGKIRITRRFHALMHPILKISISITVPSISTVQ